MMNKYTAELDGINNSDTVYYETNNYGELIRWIENDLRMLGGGHADIYDEDGDFVEDVEV
jgi:hypothetical protein